jgi:hypothetical protein
MPESRVDRVDTERSVALDAEVFGAFAFRPCARGGDVRCGLVTVSSGRAVLVRLRLRQDDTEPLGREREDGVEAGAGDVDVELGRDAERFIVPRAAGSVPRAPPRTKRGADR